LLEINRNNPRHKVKIMEIFGVTLMEEGGEKRLENLKKKNCAKTGKLSSEKKLRISETEEELKKCVQRMNRESKKNKV